MSPKRTHVQDSSVHERRLRPIYDWLDAGNYKKAIQECDKVLKKSPTLDIVRALKALSLQRLGKESDCITILDALAAQSPSDDTLLQAMTMCYRELQQLDNISKLYEAAVKIDSTNEELHTHLFMSYVRTSDFKKQQLSAATLYKLVPKNPYYCWTVMSVILQATYSKTTTDPKNRALLLTLAERMLDKMIQENKLEAEQELQLYIIVLEEQEKYDKILEVLDGDFGYLLSGDLLQLRLTYLIKLNRWTNVNRSCRRYLLLETSQAWDIWKHYLKSVFELMKISLQNNHDKNHEAEQGDTDFDSPDDDTPERAHEFICRFLECPTDNAYLLRGPFLARFELCHQLQSRNLSSSELLGDVLELFIEYFRKFGHKPCCVVDLRTYLDLLSNEQKLKLAERLREEAGNDFETEHQMQRQICAFEFSRLCGAWLNLSPHDILSLVADFRKFYIKGDVLFGKDLLITDQAPADSYCLLSVHLLHDLYLKTESSQPLLLALLLLKNVLKNSPSNFHIKLLALKIYHMLGCCTGATLIYESLDIKHVQLDSLGFIHCSQLPASGHYYLASLLVETSIKFFSTNYKDSSDHLTFSYKFGSFTKLREFMDFRERLNNSFLYQELKIDKMFLALVQCSSLEQAYTFDTSPIKIAWDKIRDNADYGVFLSYDPERIKSPIEDWLDCKKTVEQDVLFSKLRAVILECFQASIEILKSQKDNQLFEERLKNELAKYSSLRNNINVDSLSLSINLICMPFFSRLVLHEKSQYASLLPPLFKLVLGIAQEDVDVCESNSNEFCNEFNNLVYCFEKNLMEMREAKDIYLNRKSNVEYLCNLVEICSIACVISTLCLELFKSQQAGKKTKKKHWDPKLRESVLNLVNAVREGTNMINAALKKYDEEEDNLVETLSDKMVALSLTIGLTDEDDLIATLKNSHTHAIKELRTTIKNKLKMFNS